MKLQHVLVTFKVTPEQKKTLYSVESSHLSFALLRELQGASRQEALRKANILFCKSFSSREMSQEDLKELENLELVQLLFAGADAFPFHRVASGVVVASNAGAFAEPLGEHVLAMALTLGKRLMPLHCRMKEGSFDTLEKSLFFKGKTCGIIGYGGNGKVMGKLMKALGMRVEGINRHGKQEEDCSSMGTLDDLGAMLPRWDVVLLTLPLTKHTRSLIGKKELLAMKRRAIFINVGRGALVDQDALYAHMVSFPKFLVGIDTWWNEPQEGESFRCAHPFLDLPNILGSPHRADHVEEMESHAFGKALENIVVWSQGHTPRGVLRKDEYLT